MIDRVEDDYVYLNPLTDDDGYDGFGYGVGGFFLGGIGIGIGIALGAIATFTLLPLLFR